VDPVGRKENFNEKDTSEQRACTGVKSGACGEQVRGKFIGSGFLVCHRGPSSRGQEEEEKKREGNVLVFFTVFSWSPTATPRIGTGTTVLSEHEKELCSWGGAASVTKDMSPPDPPF